jgi:hypothetical protein
MTDITLDVKGRKWKFVLVPDKRYDRQHNSSEPDDGSVAITLPDLNEVHFKKSTWDIITVRHELAHVLYNMSLVSSSDLKPGQVEETFAEIIGHHCSEIIFWSDQIAHRFMKG